MKSVRWNSDHLWCSVWNQVERLLDGVDAVVYILDYTKLKTKEEAELLQKLKVSGATPPCSYIPQRSACISPPAAGLVPTFS